MIDSNTSCVEQFEHTELLTEVIKVKMKDMKYYVVELSFSKSNPIHRAICFHRSNGNVDLTASYEGTKSTNTKNLVHFKVIEEIKSMNEKFENQYKLPN